MNDCVTYQTFVNEMMASETMTSLPGGNAPTVDEVP